MEPLPHFSHIKEFVVTERKQLGIAFREGQWGWLAIHATICLFIFVVAISVTINAFSIMVSAVHNAMGVLFPEQPTSPMTLVYERIDNGKNEDGLYSSVFNLYVHSPIGNTTDRYTLWNNLTGEVECLLSGGDSISEAKGGIASSTALYKVSCVSRERIIDTGKLFTLIEREQ